MLNMVLYTDSESHVFPLTYTTRVIYEISQYNRVNIKIGTT